MTLKLFQTRNKDYHMKPTWIQMVFYLKFPKLIFLKILFKVDTLFVFDPTSELMTDVIYNMYRFGHLSDLSLCISSQIWTDLLYVRAQVC